MKKFVIQFKPFMDERREYVVLTDDANVEFVTTPDKATHHKIRGEAEQVAKLIIDSGQHRGTFEVVETEVKYYNAKITGGGSLREIADDLLRIHGEIKALMDSDIYDEWQLEYSALYVELEESEEETEEGGQK